MVKSAVLEINLDASDVLLRWRESEDEDRHHFRQSQDLLSKFQDSGSPSVAHASSRTFKLLRLLMAGPSTTETFIAAIAHLKISQTLEDPQLTKGGGDPAKE